MTLKAVVVVVVGARLADLLAQSSPGFTENGLKKRK